jgi:muramoyltetrapeptide carboxypeptidase LdcA involved in peptidoglycan recycling
VADARPGEERIIRVPKKLRAWSLASSPFRSEGEFTIFDVLREHLEPLEVPVLGGVPLGHGSDALCIPIGLPVILDADARELRTEPLGGS